MEEYAVQLHQQAKYYHTEEHARQKCGEKCGYDYDVMKQKLKNPERPLVDKKVDEIVQQISKGQIDLK